MTYIASSRLPRAAIALVSLVALCVLIQIGVLVSVVMADTGGGAPATSVVPDPISDQVAATAAEFRVNESGAATYSVPLYGVPGTAGVEPKLALSYSSQGAVGPMGKGWGIVGTSSITRCRKSHEAGDFAADGSPLTVNLSSTDQFCLDGQRLLQVSGGNFPACQANGSGLAGTQYRTEIESFQRVCAYGAASINGAAFFTVERKDGSLSWYGDRDNSSTANRPDGYFNSAAPGKTAVALLWAQTRMQDSTGNYVDYIYTENPGGAGTGEQVLSEVRYTGKTVLAGQSGVASVPYAKVMFNYSARTQAQWSKSFIAGGVVTQTQRLDSVTSCATGVAGACAVAKQARNYRLTYAPANSGSGLDTLTSLIECRDNSAGAICLPATHFDWSQGKYEFTSGENYRLPTGSLSKFGGYKMGDVDGDGRLDIVFIREGSTCPQTVNILYATLDTGGNLVYSSAGGICTFVDMNSRGAGAWQLLDYDGDGKADLWMSGPVGGNWVVYPSRGQTGSRTFDPTRNLLAGLSPGIPTQESPTDQPQMADLNGDGLIDAVYPTNAGLRARLMERQGASFGWGAERKLSLATSIAPLDSHCTDPDYSCGVLFAGAVTKTGFTQLADFDGNASSDLLMRMEEDVTYVGTGCSNTNLAANNSTVAGVGTQSAYRFNAHGTRRAKGVQASLASCPQDRYFFRTHALTVKDITSTTITLSSYASIPSDLYSVSLGDVNADGLTDLFYRTTATSGWSYRVNTGMGMAAAVSVAPAAYYDNQMLFADINGDGRTDVLSISQGIGTLDYVALLALPQGGFGQATVITTANGGPKIGLSTNNMDMNTPALADLDGDGTLDYMLITMNDNANFYVSRATQRNAPRDVITKVTNGLGSQTLIGYGALTNKDLYRPDKGSRNATNYGRGSPVSDLLSPAYVVQQASSSSPGAASGFATLYYRYGGAKAQAGGRGFLGFREMTTIDPNETGGYVSTTATYFQNFPFAGMPATTTKLAANGLTYTPPACYSNPANDACFATPDDPGLPALPGKAFSSNSQDWEADTDSAGATTVDFAPDVQAPIQVRTSGTVEKAADPITGVQTSYVLTTFTYGAYGNAVNTTVDTFTGGSATPTVTLMTANVYAADNPAAWRLGRLTGTTVTHRRPSRVDVVRTTSFAYSGSTGILNMERIQPNGSADQDLSKGYGVDDFGNRTQATVCAAPATTPCTATGLLFHPTGNAIKRSTRTAYDSVGRYPLATYGMFWNGTGAVEKPTQTIVARNFFGAVTQSYDVSGVDALAVTGTFGRAYYSWTETVAGSAPGSAGNGVDSYTTYRWCGVAPGQVSCPNGAVFRVQVTASSAPTQWSYYDVLARPVMKAAETFNVGVSGQDVAASCTGYDATGKVKQVSTPFFLAGTGGSNGPTGLATVCSSGRTWSTTTYDVIGRPTLVVAPDNSSVHSSYSGLTTTTTDARGNPTVQTRNGAGEITQVVDANGLSIGYWFQADGSNYLVTRDAGRGAVQNVFQFDTLGRKTVQVDPDGGRTTFEYNALGELTAQQDSLGNRVENEIDARGRVWRKTVEQTNGTVESQSTYLFDTAANGLGQMASESITGTYTGWVGQTGVALNYSRSYSYDVLGRPLGSSTNIDDVNYTAAAQYDRLGRPWKAQDASTGWIKTEYNSRGMPAALCPSTSADTTVACASPWQRTTATDQWGHVVNEALTATGQMSVARTYEPLTGRSSSICANSGAAGPCDMVDEGYAWDAAGNLASQLKTTRYTEDFTYDSLNRLTLGQMTKGAVTTTLDAFEYDQLGNTCRKVMAGTKTLDFTYVGRSGCGLGGNNSAFGSGGTGTTGAHQVSGITGSVFYYYDTRGNQTTKDALSATYDRTVQYSLDDKAYEATSGLGVRARFWYGSDGQRYKREDGTQRTLYLGNVEIVTNGAATTFKRTIGGVLLQTVTNNVSADYYLFHDQLGSLIKISDATGAVVNKTDFTASGYRRDYDTQGLGGQVPTLTTRGFTGHEMVDGVLNMVHMNGRVFDPALGRFMQVDPAIQAPYNTQSWNAYTYVFNNPYTFTDPSGMISATQEGYWRIAAAVVVACVGGWAAAPYIIGGTITGTGIAIMAGSGFVAGYISTGTLQGGIQGAFTAVVTAGAGTVSNVYGRIAAQAVTGGIIECLEGGNFGHGFLAAGLTAAAMPQVGKINNVVIRTAIGAIVGGTISEATGGKFANGAISGAIQGAMAGSRKQSNGLKTMVTGESTGDGTAGASPEDAALIRDPTKRQEFLDKTAMRGRALMSGHIHYVNHYSLDNPDIAAETVGREVTFYSLAFEGNYYDILNIMTHEDVHLWQNIRLGVIHKGDRNSGFWTDVREEEAYRIETKSLGFSLGSSTFNTAATVQANDLANNLYEACAHEDCNAGRAFP